MGDGCAGALEAVAAISAQTAGWPALRSGNGLSRRNTANCDWLLSLSDSHFVNFVLLNKNS